MDNLSKGLLLILIFVIVSIQTSYAQLQSINIFVNNDITCENDTVQLNIHIVQNGYNNLQFDWDNENTLTSKSIVNPKAFPSVTTVYSVTVTDINNSITLKDSIEITVLPKPVIYAGDDALLCINQNYRVINAYANNTTNFQWSHNGKGQLLQTGTLTPLYMPFNGETGEVNIILKSGGILKCQDVSDTLVLNFVNSPKISLNKNSDTICSSENYLITQPVIQNATSFEWTQNGKGTLLNNNTLTPEYIPGNNESGIVQIVLSCNNYDLCVTSDTLFLTVVNKPVINIKEKEVTLCSMTSYYFSGNTIDFATSFEWSHNGKGRLYNTKSINPVYIPGVNESDQVKIFIEATGQCGIAYDTVTLGIFNSEALNIVTDTMVCSNESIELSVPEGFTYLWSNTATTSSITVSPNKNTTYWVNVTNNIGCSVKEFINVTVSNIAIQISPDTTICEGGKVALSVTSSPEFSYSWNTGAPTNEIIVQPDFSKEYTVTVTNEDGCVATASVNVELRESPIIYLEELVDEDKPQTLIVTPDEFLNYKFTKNDEILQDSSINTYYFGNLVNLSGFIFADVTDEFGCTYQVSVDLTTILPLEFPVANAFSPNGDMINDIFLENLNGKRIVVFDRSNKILFDGYNGWDGTSNGRAMPAGTYYHIVYDENGGIAYKGPVTIVR